MRSHQGFAIQQLESSLCQPTSKWVSFTNQGRIKAARSAILRGGWVVRKCWINFQCRGVLLIWIIVEQGPIALAVGAGGGCLDIFSLICHFSFLSPSLWETARYRLKYYPKGPLSLKQPNQLANNTQDSVGL